MNEVGDQEKIDIVTYRDDSIEFIKEAQKYNVALTSDLQSATGSGEGSGLEPTNPDAEGSEFGGELS